MAKASGRTTASDIEDSSVQTVAELWAINNHDSSALAKIADHFSVRLQTLRDAVVYKNVPEIWFVVAWRNSGLQIRMDMLRDLAEARVDVSDRRQASLRMFGEMKIFLTHKLAKKSDLVRRASTTMQTVNKWLEAGLEVADTSLPHPNLLKNWFAENSVRNDMFARLLGVPPVG